jgi:2,5-diamino-6-(ribosylamino)-4(3H)-pyrimidinone 5'-phosphate reductase
LGKPEVIIHNAISADGRIDGFPADLGVYYGLITEWQEDATLVGSETLLSAVEETTDNDWEDEGNLDIQSRPYLVVPDSRGRIRNWAYFQKLPYWKEVIVIGSKATPENYRTLLKEKNIDFIISGEDHVDYQAALSELNSKYNIKTIRVDSGGTLNGFLLKAGLVEKISILIHPFFVGGETCKTIYRSKDLLEQDELISLKMVKLERLDEDLIWLLYEVLPNKRK